MMDIKMQNKVFEEYYENEMALCNNEVSRLFPNNQENAEQDEQSSNQNGNNDQAQPSTTHRDVDLFKAIRLHTHNKEVGCIMVKPELKLMLLDHWTLYDSI